MMQDSMPSCCARWSIPSVPNMSPAAIGWTIVRSPGAPSASKSLPSAANTASGQQSPLEELTATVSPELINFTACAAVDSFFILDGLVAELRAMW